MPKLTLAAVLISLLGLPTPAASSPAGPLAHVEAPIWSQDEEQKPDKRPEVKELLERLKGHASKRGREDPQVIEAVDGLLVEFAQSGLKDRKSITKGLSGCFKQKRPAKDGVFQNQMYLACAVALGRMGPESVSELEGWIGHKTHRKDIQLQRQLILALGKTRSEKAVKPLVDLLDDKTPTVQGAAAEALGNFEWLESKDRKEVFEEILKTLTSASNAKDSDPLDTVARERYDAIAASMITSMQVLSGHDERVPSKWRTWWNKNKKRDWDKED